MIKFSLYFLRRVCWFDLCKWLRCTRHCFLCLSSASAIPTFRHSTPRRPSTQVISHRRSSLVGRRPAIHKLNTSRPFARPAVLLAQTHPQFIVYNALLSSSSYAFLSQEFSFWVSTKTWLLVRFVVYLVGTPNCAFQIPVPNQRTYVIHTVRVSRLSAAEYNYFYAFCCGRCLLKASSLNK